MKKMIRNSIILLLFALSAVCFVDYSGVLGTSVTPLSVTIENPVSPSEVESMSIQHDKGSIRVPSVGIDTDYSVMSMYRKDGVNIINPPSYDKPYLVRDFGSADKDSFGVVAMHSIRRYKDIPGSRLIDISAAKSRVSPGDSVFLDDVEYVITRVESEKKSQVSSDKSVWDGEPGELVIVTCLQRPTGKSVNNIVIYAKIV